MTDETKMRLEEAGEGTWWFWVNLKEDGPELGGKEGGGKREEKREEVKMVKFGNGA